MLNSLNLVKQFHKAFNISINKKPSFKDGELRLKLFKEELQELEDAINAKDEIEVLDALLDLEYVLMGSYLSLGYHRYREDGFKEVHESNMSKLGEDGKPLIRDDGKILKGPKFFTPNIKKIIEKSKNVHRKENSN